jgi:hypothetical protein
MKRAGFLTISFGLCLMLFITATAAPFAAAAPPAQGKGLTLEDLLNAEYLSSMVEGGRVPLSDGVYQAAASADTASDINVALGDMVVFGDIDGNGSQDAAALLISNAGGSGTFYDLAVVVDDQGTARNIAIKPLGDRVQVQSLSIRGDEIVVDMITHGPDDAMCCPTLAVTRSFRLAGDKLIAAGPLFPYSDGTAYGYVDITGSWVIEPQFEFATEFIEDLARVTVDEKQGFIDPTGKMVIQPTYRYAQNFSEGFALVDRAGPDEDRAQWVFIDTQGKVTADLSAYVAATDFSDGLAGVTNGAKYGFIDTSGKLAIPLEYEFASRFSEGLAVVSIDGESGFIDTKGAVAIEPQFDFASDFSEGLAAVTLDEKTGYVDTNGNWAIKPAFELGYDFSEGLAFVNTGQKAGYIDATGRIAIEGDFSFGYLFSEGMAAVDIEGLLGYIDQTGQMVIEPQFTLASPFKDGIARVSMDTTWGAIDTSGAMLFELPMTDYFGGPLPTDVVKYIPSPPGESRKGECTSMSQATSIDTAWRCTALEEDFDPCLLADDGETVVCGMDPTAGEHGFRLELSQPLPKPKRPTTSGAAIGLTENDLANADYNTEWASTGVAHLEDGTYTEKYEDSATGLVIALTDMSAFGDLDGDGTPDAVAVLGTNGGGSGVFIDLVAVLDKSGSPIHVATTLLGDRVIVNSLSITDQVVTVDMITQGPGDGMCCPTLPVTFKFRLEGDQFIQVGETPWRLQLANGAVCALNSEAALAFGDKRVNYECDNGTSLLGDVMPGIPWTATQVTLTKGDRGTVISDTKTVNVAIVWQPTDPDAVISQIGLSADSVSLKPRPVASIVTAHVRPGAPFNPMTAPQMNGAPPHLRFSFDDQTLPDWPGVFPDLPQMLVFPLDQYQEMYRRVGLYEFDQQLETLQAIAAGTTAVGNEEIAVLPAIPAVQTFVTQVQDLQFEGGEGIRFLTHYALDVAPITNDMLFYTFQGITDDGKYYVALYYPVSTNLLPNDFEDANVEDNYDIFVQNYESYLDHTVLALEESAAGSFTPDLSELDAMVESIIIRD